MNQTIKTLPVKQNKQDFLIGVFSIKDIFQFTKYTERLIVGYDENEEPIYNKQIQRKIEKPRVDKIADFLMHDPDATFPTNIVLHIPKEVIADYQEKNNEIYVTLENKVFEEVKKNGDIFISIIDGQHRIKGIEQAIYRLKSEITVLQQTLRGGSNESLENKLSFFKERLEDLYNIELVVTFFIDKTLEYQAMVFSTINRTQKRVSQSLVYSLFGLDTDDTPQKSALEIVLSLNGHPKSPFYKRIKLYGGSYGRNNTPPLSQATMVRSIVSLISENLRESEKDRYKKRSELKSRSSGSKKVLPFRQYYANDKDSYISDLLFFFFTQVRNTFVNENGKSLWDFDESNQPTNILHTTVGYFALLDILVDILQEIKILEPLDYDNSVKIFYDRYLIEIKDIDVTDNMRYSFSQRGKKYFYLDLSLKIWPPTSNSDKRIKELELLAN